MRDVSKISGGVGGHIDFDSEGKMENPVFGAMIRELKEEVIIKEYPSWYRVNCFVLERLLYLNQKLVD